ncbi:hypothetical protein [Sulfitobacter pacificus]|uniref:Lipoprotein n=1 Tax=Sulfitobacter pacificus TaxID=1499314 RepID=A0ABQ5VF83_9RHOB|nr:hypothetical protein [Sulfitobacter pacificus]GLQ25712.1 hypothetical protein GCM10007927_05150 [Sulfitobacter pacificus]
MKPLRLTAGAALIATLSACGGGETVVRNGPQAVHPSPSQLAQRPHKQAAPRIQSVHHIIIVKTANPCHETQSCGHHTARSRANDGSTPIID